MESELYGLTEAFDLCAKLDKDAGSMLRREVPVGMFKDLKQMPEIITHKRRRSKTGYKLRKSPCKMLISVLKSTASRSHEKSVNRRWLKQVEEELETTSVVIK